MCTSRLSCLIPKSESIYYMAYLEDSTMDEIKLLYNPNCSKCRNALATLNENDIEPEVVEYLSEPLSEKHLRQVIDILEDDPTDLVRKDRNFDELGLDANDYQDVDSIVSLLMEHPILMQRPVAIQGQKAFIARTPDKVETLLK